MSTYLNADCMNKKTGIPSLPDRSYDIALIEIPKDITAASAMRTIKQCQRAARVVVLLDFPRFGWFPANGSAFMFHLVDQDAKPLKSVVACSTAKHGIASASVLVKAPQGKNDPLPVELYRRLLVEIKATDDCKVLVPFSVDASALIALEAIGCEYTAFNAGRLDYQNANRRLVKARAQLSLFAAKDIQGVQQVSIFDKP